MLIPAWVAIKLFRKPRDSEKAASAHHEIFIFQDVKRQHIVRLHELVETSRHLGLVLTYYSGGNLATYIFTHNHVEEQLAGRMFAQLVSALGYLHEKGIVHGSILTENLLLDDNENLFVSSLALVRKYGPRTETGGSYYRSKLGYSFTRDSTILDIGLRDDHWQPPTHKRFNGRYQLANSLYAAPELTAHELPHLMAKMDVWSCGVILVRFSSGDASPIDYYRGMLQYAMLAGHMLLDDDPQSVLNENIIVRIDYILSQPLSFPEHVPRLARELLGRMIVGNPSKRADLFEIATHDWLKNHQGLLSSGGHPNLLPGSKKQRDSWEFGGSHCRHRRSLTQRKVPDY